MGDASTLSSTSSSPGTGRSCVAIDSSITPSSVKVERSSLALVSDIRILSCWWPGAWGLLSHRHRRITGLSCGAEYRVQGVCWGKIASIRRRCLCLTYRSGPKRAHEANTPHVSCACQLKRVSSLLLFHSRAAVEFESKQSRAVQQHRQRQPPQHCAHTPRGCQYAR